MKIIFKIFFCIFLFFTSVTSNSQEGLLDAPCFVVTSSIEPPGEKGSGELIPDNTVNVSSEMGFESCMPDQMSGACEKGFFSLLPNKLGTSSNRDVRFSADTKIKQGKEMPTALKNSAGSIILTYSPATGNTEGIRDVHGGSNYLRLNVQGPGSSTGFKMTRPADGTELKLWLYQAYIYPSNQEHLLNAVHLEGRITRGATVAPITIPLNQNCHIAGNFIPSQNVPSGGKFISPTNSSIVMKVCSYEQTAPISIPPGAEELFTLELSLKTDSQFVYIDSGRNCQSSGRSVPCSTFSPLAILSIDDISLNRRPPTFQCNQFDIKPIPPSNPQCQITGGPSPLSKLRIKHPNGKTEIIKNPASVNFSTLFSSLGQYTVDAVCTATLLGNQTGYCGKSENKAIIYVRPQDDFCRFMKEARSSATSLKLPADIETAVSNLKISNKETGFAVYRKTTGEYTMPEPTDLSSYSADVWHARDEIVNWNGGLYVGIITHTHPEDSKNTNDYYPQVYSASPGTRGANITRLKGAPADMELFLRNDELVSILKTQDNTWMLVKPITWVKPDKTESTRILSRYIQGIAGLLIYTDQYRRRRYEASYLAGACNQLNITLYRRDSDSKLFQKQ